jgi:hypothetical protein
MASLMSADEPGVRPREFSRPLPGTGLQRMTRAFLDEAT